MIPFPESIIACPDCDLLQRIPTLTPGGTASCLRCGHTLASSKPDSLDRTLALTVAALIALIIANVMPLMGLSAVGRQAVTTILGGVLKLWQQGHQITAVLVAFCTVVAPTVHIGFTLTVLLAVRQTPAPIWVGTLLRMADFNQPWAMLEVMMLGILVALIKIADLATVIPGVGMFAVGALIMLIAAMTVSFDKHQVWSQIRWVDGEGQQLTSSPEFKEPAEGEVEGKETPGELTGIKMGLVLCEGCGLLTKPTDLEKPGHCPRCGQELELRRPNSIQRTWALLIAASICYIPANLLPVMSTTTPTYAEKDTIMSGVVLLYVHGSWPLALIVFVASVVIPMAKIVALAYLLISVQCRFMRSKEERIRLYRLVEIVGRWSMLDVFVVTFVVALVQLQPLMSVGPGAGVVFFAAVVVLTMLAAETFDPRLIWDSRNNKEEQNDEIC
ncbi:MAG: Inner membrane protein YebS [Syntrophus sp. PtaB.Bin138]|jgi:paraquat-inducible protein A|nr:MAG: Inner membrane protein YebS [Syntrophus sp. PtaB.Bin138]